jgi:uncharacterized protein
MKSERAADKESSAVLASTAYDAALDEMYSGAPDVGKALALLKEAHAAGDNRATYALATWYIHGKAPVVKRDLGNAVALLKEAARAGNPDALFDLGVAYESGETGEPDVVEAFRSYVGAALRGHLQSLYEVGRCYEHGIGVPADIAIADIWLNRAAELGITE